MLGDDVVCLSTGSDVHAGHGGSGCPQPDPGTVLPALDTRQHPGQS